VYEIVRSRVRPAAAAFREIPEARAMGQLIEEIVSFEHGVDAEPDAVAV
jgi:hypothetical protein